MNEGKKQATPEELEMLEKLADKIQTGMESQGDSEPASGEEESSRGESQADAGEGAPETGSTDNTEE